jgi:hypothetical protein
MHCAVVLRALALKSTHQPDNNDRCGLRRIQTDGCRYEGENTAVQERCTDVADKDPIVHTTHRHATIPRPLSKVCMNACHKTTARMGQIDHQPSCGVLDIPLQHICVQCTHWHGRCLACIVGCLESEQTHCTRRTNDRCKIESCPRRLDGKADPCSSDLDKSHTGHRRFALTGMHGSCTSACHSMGWIPRPVDCTFHLRLLQRLYTAAGVASHRATLSQERPVSSSVVLEYHCPASSTSSNLRVRQLRPVPRLAPLARSE